MADRVHHYTDRLSAADVVRAGLIRAHPLTLHRDIFARDAGLDTVPVVWFTAAPDPEPTVLLKLAACGWPMPPVGDLYRFALPADHPSVRPFPRPEGDPIAGADCVWWQWALATAHAAGSRWEDWRLVTDHVPLAHVVAVERLAAAGASPAECRWEGVWPWL